MRGIQRPEGARGRAMGGVAGIGGIDAVLGLGTGRAVTAAMAAVITAAMAAAIAAITIAPAAIAATPASAATSTAATSTSAAATSTAGCPGGSAAEIRTGEAWLHGQGAGQHDGETYETQRG